MHFIFVDFRLLSKNIIHVNTKYIYSSVKYLTNVQNVPSFSELVVSINVNLRSTVLSFFLRIVMYLGGVSSNSREERDEKKATRQTESQFG